MMPAGLFSQIALILLSMAIIFSFVKPKLEEIKAIDNSITVYQQEQQKVESVNKKLSNLKATINGISDTDRRNLLTYMPNAVDTIAVPRDVETIVKAEGGILKSIKHAGVVKDAVGEVVEVNPNAPIAHEFDFSIEGSYGQLKNIFTSFEQNAYPLEVFELHIDEQEGGFLRADGKVRTYSRRFSGDATSTVTIMQ